jgi:hypothetical protein
VSEEYDESDDDYEENCNTSIMCGRTIEDEDEEELTCSTSTRPTLEDRMKDKIISLQDQLLQHAFGNPKLSDNDVIRYSAMIDVLKAMLA